MLTRRNVLLGGACAALAAPAAAADASARAFVAAIYETYVGKDGNGISLDSEKTVQRFFEPSLAALILRDQKEAEARNETGALDFDPFVDGQDWDIAAYDIALSDSGSDRANATVKFNNFDKPTTIVLELVKIKNEWKIKDIAWQHDDKPTTLRGLYAH